MPSTSRPRPRPRRLTVLAAAGGLLASLAVAVGVSSPSEAASCSGTTVGPVTCVWMQLPSGKIAQSSPTATMIGGQRAVLTGGLDGRLIAWRASDGATLWSRATGAGQIDAALSVSPSGGTVFVGQTTSAKGQPELAAYRTGDGGRIWAAHACPVSTPCRQLSAMTVSGAGVFTGGRQQYVYGVHNGAGSPLWSYLNSDTTNSTPAVADLTGLGQKLVVYTTDQTPNAAVGALSGGHLRIFTPSGQQVCNANIGGGPAAPGSFSSSPAVGSFGGAPLIVFGTGQSGSNPRRVLAFNASCQHVWSSVQLAGNTVGAPSIADVLGTGTPQVIQEVKDANGNPVLNLLNGRTGARLLSVPVRTPAGANCGPAAEGTSYSVSTATIGGRPYLVVPAGHCGAALMVGGNGTLRTLGMLAPNCGVSNTPLITNDDAGHIGITVTGYKASAGGGSTGCVYHYRAAGQIGSGDWPQFHRDPQLSGTSSLGQVHDTMLTGQQMKTGQTLHSANDRYVFNMQRDGNLVVYDRSRPAGSQAIWASRTSSPGAALKLGSTTLYLLSSTGKKVWGTRSFTVGARPLHLVLRNDGKLCLYVSSTNRWGADVLLWHS